MVSLSPERANFLRRCWQTRRWNEGVRVLLSPVHSSLYRLYRMAAGRPSTVTTPAPADIPNLTAEIHPIFATPPVTHNPVSRHNVAGIGSLFSDVDQQLEGIFRLAGAHYLRVDAPTLKRLANPEDRHAYHRLYWMARYARAAAFGHPRAAEGVFRHWADWLAGFVHHDPVSSVSYTVSERIASLTEALFWIKSTDSRQLLDLVLPLKRQIWRDAHYLQSNIEYPLGLHNHLLNNARALFLAADALQECSDASLWRVQAFGLWREYFPSLLLADGVFAEQSSHYHVLLCRTALEYWLAARRWWQKSPDGFLAQTVQMFRLANDLLRPDGSMPRFGDNSPDHLAEDLWGLPAAAYYHGLLAEPPRHRAITPLTLYYCGLIPEIPEEVTPHRVRVYQNGGFGFLRSARLGMELAAHGDPRPEIRAHGDTGRGSFELWWRGNVIIREPGSYISFTGGDDGGHGGASQNVTCLDGLAPGIAREDRQCAAAWYWAEGGAWDAVNDSGFQFRCDGFRRLHPDLCLFRVWRLDDEGNLNFEERADGSTRIRFESRLCLGDGHWGPLTWNDTTGEGAIGWQGRSDSIVKMAFRAPPGFSAVIEQLRVTPEYGVSKPAHVLCLRGHAQAPFRWTVKWQVINTPEVETRSARKP